MLLCRRPRCVLYSSLLGIEGEIPNGKGRKRCPNHCYMRSSGRTSKSTINCIATANPGCVSFQETSRHSLAGWTSTPPLLFLGKQEGYRSSKKRGEVE